jgi:hypothetical protein
MKIQIGALLVVGVCVAIGDSGGDMIDFKGWRYPNAVSCDAARKEFEANYKKYPDLIAQCRAQNPNAVPDKITSFSCYAGSQQSLGVVVSATVACAAPCVNPPTACPPGTTNVGMFNSPTGTGWGKGTYAACLENTTPVSQGFCSAQFFPNSDHKCDDYAGYSTVTNIGGKSYCVYGRVNSTYYRARLIETGTPTTPTVTMGGLFIPDRSDCADAKAAYQAIYKEDARLKSQCQAKAAGTKPGDLVSLDCARSGSGTVLTITVKCQ